MPLIDGGTQRLPRVVGTGRALDLILTGRTIEAAEAKSMGLITEIAGRTRHVVRALQLAEEIAAHPQRHHQLRPPRLLEGEGLPLARARPGGQLGREPTDRARGRAPLRPRNSGPHRVSIRSLCLDRAPSR